MIHRDSLQAPRRDNSAIWYLQKLIALFEI